MDHLLVNRSVIVYLTALLLGFLYICLSCFSFYNRMK